MRTRLPFRDRTTAVMALVLVLMACTLTGQEKKKNGKAGENANAETVADEKAAAETPDDVEDGSGSILRMILGSGPTGIIFMVVLGVFSIVAGTVAVERAVRMRRDRILPPEFVDQFQELVQGSSSADSYRQLCSTTDATMATVLSAGLIRVGAPLMEIEKALEDAAAREMAEIRARIRPLSTIGAIAPLVGLLGTVVGMIVAFHTASQEGLGKAELLAKGIYMALLTTAGGLSVAIPSLMLATHFNSRAETYFRQMDKFLMQALPRLSGRVAAVPLMTGGNASSDGRLAPHSAKKTKPKKVPVPSSVKSNAKEPEVAVSRATVAEDVTSEVTGSQVLNAEVVQVQTGNQQAEPVVIASRSDTSENEQPGKETDSKRPASSRSKKNPLMSDV